MPVAGAAPPPAPPAPANGREPSLPSAAPRLCAPPNHPRNLGRCSLGVPKSRRHRAPRPHTQGAHRGERTMAMSAPYPATLEFDADRTITRWRPLVQWLLAIPHLAIAHVLRTLRQVLTIVGLSTV